MCEYMIVYIIYTHAGGWVCVGLCLPAVCTDHIHTRCWMFAGYTGECMHVGYIVLHRLLVSNINVCIMVSTWC